MHQPSYSMLNRWIEDGLLDVLGELGAGCIVFSPLAQGIERRDRLELLAQVVTNCRARSPLGGQMRPAGCGTP